MSEHNRINNSLVVFLSAFHLIKSPLKFEKILVFLMCTSFATHDFVIQRIRWWSLLFYLLAGLLAIYSIFTLRLLATLGTTVSLQALFDRTGKVRIEAKMSFLSTISAFAWFNHEKQWKTVSSIDPLHPRLEPTFFLNEDSKSVTTSTREVN